MSKITPDYTLYFVTDSTMVPETSTFLDQVRLAVENGATIIQLREKSILTLDFIERAQKVLEITRPKGIPLIINDRVDVALAVDADGVHVGQDDMPAATVRKLIGKNKILGVSCGNVAETTQVCEEGVADYVGLGTVYPTQTKKVKAVVGPIGIRRSLEVLSKYKKEGKLINSVAIGGIKHSNAAKVLFQCLVPGYEIDGVAVVSCIMAATDAGKATRELLASIRSPVAWKWTSESSVPFALGLVDQKPLVHHITNNVVKNFSANVTLAIGASPIMSELPEEFGEFACLPSVALLINLGTPSTQLMEVFLLGLRTYNAHGSPVIFDPVAAGASCARREACRVLLNAGYFSVIKGNLGEITALAQLGSDGSNDSETLMQGVDSLIKSSDDATEALCKKVATEYRSVVVVTGEINYIYDGTQPLGEVLKVKGGSEYMGLVTGTGCSLGSTIAAYVAVARKQKLDIGKAVVSAVTMYNQAGKVAAKDVEGPGTFMVRFLDELARESKKVN
ncbi:CIC11C00000002783 [Sungouiella intermedia]|uniref:CIC11C00000002783 n=1 Tax=Sungouiella intermedia TaxID=45354 RepID=A0A1L0D4L6_9ASCO|nr:CIC11C00000002783 [[Candida] intermedia]